MAQLEAMMMFSVNQLLEYSRKEASSQIESLKQENATLEVENQQLKGRVDEGHYFALEYINDVDYEMKQLNVKADEVDNLKLENTGLKAKVQQLETNTKEVEILKLKNTKLNSKIQQLENSMKEADNLKLENTELKAEIQRQRTLRYTLTQRLDNKTKKIDNLQLENVDLNTKIEQLKNNTKEVDNLTFKNTKLKTKILQLENNAKEMDEENIMLKYTIQQLKNELTSKTYILDKDIAELKTKIQEKENEIQETNNLKQKNIQLEGIIQQIRNEVRERYTLKEENAKLKANIQRISGETDLLKQEGSKLEAQIQRERNTLTQQLDIKAKKIDSLKLENVDLKTKIDQLKSNTKEAGNLKLENTELKTKIQQLENNAKELDDLKLKIKTQRLEKKTKEMDDLIPKHAELKTKKPQLENKRKEAETIKQLNKKCKKEERPDDNSNQQQIVNTIESSQSELNIQKIKQIEKHVTAFINNFKLAITQFKIDVEKRNRQKYYFEIRKVVNRYAEKHLIQKKFEDYKRNYRRSRNEITMIVNSRNTAVMKIRNAASKCALQIDNILEDIISQTEELYGKIEEDTKAVKKSINIERRLYAEILDIHSSIQNRIEANKDPVEKMDVSADSRNRKRISEFNSLDSDDDY